MVGPHPDLVKGLEEELKRVAEANIPGGIREFNDAEMVSRMMNQGTMYRIGPHGLQTLNGHPVHLPAGTLLSVVPIHLMRAAAAAPAPAPAPAQPGGAKRRGRPPKKV